MTDTEFKLTGRNYRHLFDNASDAMWVHDIDNNIMHFNNAFLKLTGFTREEIADKNANSFFDCEYYGRANKIRRQLLEGEEIPQPYDQKLIRKDGAVRTVQMATSLVAFEGKVMGFLHIARDVTEEKSMEETLSTITDGSPIATFVIDKEHKVTHWNTAIEALSGIGKQEILGTDKQWRSFYTERRPTLADLIVDGADAEMIEAYYMGKNKKSTLIKGAYEVEDFFPALAEQGRWLRFTASPIRDRDGEITGAIETLEDVTEENQLQENMRFYVRQVTKAQEEERKRISRELHDDVSSSLLLLIRNLDAIATDKQVNQPQQISRELEVLRSQAVETLEQLRRCAQDLRPRILDDMGLVASLEWMAENLEKETGIKATVEVKGDEQQLPDEVKLMLFRIAQEALNNVWRHSQASNTMVKLDIGNEKVSLTISDNGRGFKPPQRIDDMTNAEKLGLMGMFERAQLLRGTLKIDSEAGKGTQIIIEFPLQGWKETNHQPA